MPSTRKHPQGVYWIATIPGHTTVLPCDSLPEGLTWIRGQLEEGDGGYVHWQVAFAFPGRVRLAACTAIFGEGCHFELSRSAAVRDYVWKDDTSLGERFEFGAVPITTSNRTDWDAVWESAKIGDIDSIPAGVRIRNYSALRTIGSDYSRPVSMVRDVRVFWGSTGTGKSRRAWHEAGNLNPNLGNGAYAKCPRTKFWDGYSGEESVIIDEFRGGIDVAHLLRWFDRYPVRVEVKGSTRPFHGRTVWITSNVNPIHWYPDIDAETLAALLRRFTLVEEFS